METKRTDIDMSFLVDNNVAHQLTCKNYISICCLNTCFHSSPVAERSIVFGLRLLEVHAIDGAAVHSGGSLPGRLGSGGMVRDIRPYSHCWRGICSLCLWGEWRWLGRRGRT